MQIRWKFLIFNIMSQLDDGTNDRAEGLADEERRDLSLEQISFDEMNLVELPFSLLTRNTDGIHEIPLSSDGRSLLACLNSSLYGLPNSLAPHVVLGLMWMWKSAYGGKVQTFTVKVRELVERYMYPDRFKTYPANAELLEAVERQINCVANSRIHTDRWWNNELKKRQQANISIIDAVTVLNEGSPGCPRTLSVSWGLRFFQSMVRRYTKPLDAKLVQRLERPIDLALYRLLDRQLADKPSQTYNSIVDLARYKLGMHGSRLASGGRTASSYVAQKLTEAINRLDSERFVVLMTIDREVVPFRVTFERVDNPRPKQPHEVQDRDAAGELVHEFRRHAHGDQKRSRVAERDRAMAKEWVELYGLEKAKWMVERCVQMQKERHAPDILRFRGLELYESAAAGAYERRMVAESVQSERELADELDAYWRAYRTKLVQRFDAQTIPEELGQLEAQVRERVERERAGSSEVAIKAFVRSKLWEIKTSRANAIPEAEFRAHRSLRTLREAVIERHGVDLLAP